MNPIRNKWFLRRTINIHKHIKLQMRNMDP